MGSGPGHGRVRPAARGAERPSRGTRAERPTRSDRATEAPAEAAPAEAEASASLNAEQEAAVDRLVQGNTEAAGTPAGDRSAQWKHRVDRWRARLG